MGWLSLGLAALSGYWLMRAWRPSSLSRAGWLHRLCEACLGIGAGLGISSCLFFLLLWAKLAQPAAVLASQLVLAVAAFFAARRRIHATALPPSNVEDETFGTRLRAAGAVAITLLVGGWYWTTQASPHGDWDAFAIWNLRAKYLASGSDAWRNAVTADVGGGHLGAAHPDYPLLLCALVAQAWRLGGDTDPWTPAIVGLLFSLLTPLLLLSSLGALRGESAGWLALLLLVSSESFVSQSASQYADIPLAFYALAAVALLASSERQSQSRTHYAWAGFFAALAAWTKNEGLVFLLLILLWIAWRAGLRPLIASALGALPVALVVGTFKWLVAPFSVGLFPATLGGWIEKLTDPGRWALIASFYARSAWELGFWWAQPLVLALLWLGAVGRAESSQRRAAWVGAIPIAMLAAGFMVYLVTVADLRWHLSTSCNRLWLQMWPSLLFALFLAARPYALQAAAPASRPDPKRKRSRR